MPVVKSGWRIEKSCEAPPVVAQNSTGQRVEAGDFHEPTLPSRVMVTILLAVVSIIAFRFRSRAALELKLIAVQHQLAVLHRQRPGRPQLSPLDRLLWVLLYRIWPPVTGPTACSDGRPHSSAAHSRRPASPIRADLIYGRDSPGTRGKAMKVNHSERWSPMVVVIAHSDQSSPVGCCSLRVAPP